MLNLKLSTHVTEDIFSNGCKMYDASGDLIATVMNKMPPVFLTKEVFDRIPDGEVFKVVITKIQTVHDPMNAKLKFLCKKGHGNDWAIYYSHSHIEDYVVASNGDKVMSVKCIQEICPCDPEVLKLYRH